MKIIDIASLRKLFLEYLDESKYELEQEGFNDVTDVKFGTPEEYAEPLSGSVGDQCLDTIGNDLYVYDGNRWKIVRYNIDDPEILHHPVDEHFKNNSGDPNGHIPDAHNKIFLEYGFYNEAIEQVPLTEEELITPGIFAYDGADLLNNPNYEAYNVMVALELLGFESQRESIRRLLERYAVDLRGKTLKISYKNGVFAWGSNLDASGEIYDAIISVEFPVLSETMSQSGYDRFQAYINLDFTVLRDIQIANDTDFTIDGASVSYTSLDILRKKVTKSFAVRTSETKSYAENQSISFVVSGVVNTATTVGLKIQNAILDDDYLNESFTLSYGGNSYTMYLAEGSMSVIPGESTSFTARFENLKEGI